MQSLSLAEKHPKEELLIRLTRSLCTSISRKWPLKGSKSGSFGQEAEACGQLRRLNDGSFQRPRRLRVKSFSWADVSFVGFEVTS
jgi:hypothetical protein